MRIPCRSARPRSRREWWRATPSASRSIRFTPEVASLAGTFFVTVTPSGDTATLTDAAAVEQRFGPCSTTQTVSFATREDTTVTANRALSFTLATRAGTDARITVTDDNVVEVAVIDDDRHATGAPTIAGTAQVDQVLTASPGSIADGDGLSGRRLHLHVVPRGRQ